jgi:protein-tyrosine phosphatase
MIDLHSHILPGLDDGAVTMEDSLQMIRQAIDCGIQMICATPHILDQVASAFPQKVNHSFQLLCSRIDQQELSIRLFLGSEIYIRKDMIALRKFNFFSLNQTGRYVLFELPLGQFPWGVDQLVYELGLEGVIPIIAHPERSITQKSHLREVEELVRLGALMQINAGSLTGNFGRSIRKVAETLLKRDIAHVVASDAHDSSSRSVQVLPQAYEKTSKLVGREKAERLFKHNPRLILKGEGLVQVEMGSSGEGCIHTTETDASLMETGREVNTRRFR